MSELIYRQQAELAAIINRHTEQEGVNTTAIPSLYVIRRSHTTPPNHTVYKPSICMIVQGAKEVWLAQERYRYSPTDYLVASVDLPVTSRVVEASSEEPYLAINLVFTPSQILEVIGTTDRQTGKKVNAKRALYVSPTEPTMLDAVIRLARLLDHQQDIPVLAPLITKEILYRVMQGQHGGTLEQIAFEGSSTNRVRHVIEQIVINYTHSLRIEKLAESVNMSVASLHRHFKEVTAMSPIQFQKQLRLQEARRLLLSESTDAADVAYQVGYESPSQFSREYSRMYGLPPREDIKRLRGIM
ncbi:AraC family transcriptional regulator CmrA [Paenibacillus sp. JCM 10914]|uniref:AraC family transcriptional regulator n=1 Tax=Paenibacillus sp. JCM 10914 TaxID=1236974 RepID=UPI0003CC9600|nr:AraC family transcriptional regulator [Paenibacillus sp. JCM 10914]GAE08913.1 transcriptional regulator, AraC family [Paenibacillus sp. JCM 10914]